jgi:hypothetical protein
MDSTEKRPRIPADLAARVQARNPQAPFERLVRDALELWAHQDEQRSTMDGLLDELTDTWIGEIFQMDLQRWDAFAAKARKRIEDELHQQALEDEHMDDEVMMTREGFHVLYPTDEEKRGYFRQQNKWLKAHGRPLLDPRDDGWDIDL